MYLKFQSNQLPEFNVCHTFKDADFRKLLIFSCRILERKKMCTGMWMIFEQIFLLEVYLLLFVYTFMT